MYSDYIKINKNFQSSVNLELDLNSEKKINEYIPTNDICDVLKRYIISIIGKGERATTLVGPYGKGKSFLLLVLSYLISQNPKLTAYKKLVNKIKKTDEDLYDKISNLNSSNQKLLPVIINSNYDNLNQAFMLALNDALKREKITDIVPRTTYEVCLELIDEWNKDSDFTKKVMSKCQKELGTTRDKIEMGLRDYSPDAYDKFVTLYNCITHGVPFNPLISDDIVHVYKEVNYELKKYGFSGIFIIFDEFSKFLESSSDAQSKNLKIIQDFAEAATRSSKEEQLHICCVTHKSFSLYKTTDITDSFKTVEGRFKEIKFNRSLDDNYQIISAAIDNEEYKNQIDEYIHKENEFYKKIKVFEPFRRDINLNDLIKGCFPLNPLTVYSLIQLSELVAQNERTLFTFICDIDDNSLNSFLHKNDHGLFNVDKIYDYFSPLLRREEGNAIRNIWYRAEGTLSRIEDSEERMILKTLAIILMIDNPDMFPASEENIALATTLPAEVVSGKIADLIDRRYLRKNLMNKLLSFASSNNKEIEDRIITISQTKKDSIAEESILNDINDTKYLLPRRYNEQNKITRFYKVLFITEHQLLNLNSFDIFKENGFSDGIVLNLIRKKMNDRQIKERYYAFNDQNVIIKYPKQKISSILSEELLRYAAIKELLNKGGNDQVIVSELELLLQETVDDIKSIIDRHFDDDFCYLTLPEHEPVSFNEVLSEHMDIVYPKKAKFNNELINKNTITTVYQKAVNRVVGDLLDRKTTDYSETSPETTIKNSVISVIDDQPDVVEIMSDIKNRILEAEKQKLIISNIVEKYSEPPYGIRKGILIVLFAKCIEELSDNIILYYKNKEIDLNAANLVKAIYSDSDYFLKCSKGTAAQYKYMDSLFEAAGIARTGNFRIDNRLISEELRKIFVGLPSIIKNIETDNYLNIPEGIIQYKKCFTSLNINPYEVVFEKPLEIYDTTSYNKIQKEITSFITNWETYLIDFKNILIKDIKKSMSISKETSIHSGLNQMLHDKLLDNKPLLEERDNKIYNTITTLSYDDIEAVNELASAILGIHIEDWINDRTDQLCIELKQFIVGLDKTKKINTSESSLDKMLNEIENAERTDMGILLRNNLENVLDEFGDSLSSKEKMSILAEMLKKYL